MIILSVNFNVVFLTHATIKIEEEKTQKLIGKNPTVMKANFSPRD